MWSSKLLVDTRGTSTVEYAVLLFAVLLASAGAIKKLGPRVAMDASITTRILSGEDVALNGSATAPSPGDSRSAMSRSFGSSAAADEGSSKPSVQGGGSRALLPSGSAFGGGLVLGATGAPSIAGSSTDALLASNTTTSATPSAFSSAPTTPHFTAALFENPAAKSGAKSTGSVSAKTSTSASTKTKPTTTTTASKAKTSVATTSANGGYSISAKGEAQMAALLNEAKSQADGKPPLGHCYASVADYIDAVGYGNMGKAPGSSLPSVPDAYGTYAHQFADYMNAKGANGETNASRLGLQKLPITNPYDAPPGSIVVVRAGTPGTANPVAGDIVVVGKNGQFYNDGNMGYGGSQNFPRGNTYVLGVYAPK